LKQSGKANPYIPLVLMDLGQTRDLVCLLLHYP
jgi:hypothetical protein